MRSNCTLFHGKWLSFEGGEARTNLGNLRGHKLLPYTVVMCHVQLCNVNSPFFFLLCPLPAFHQLHCFTSLCWPSVAFSILTPLSFCAQSSAKPDFFLKLFSFKVFMASHTFVLSYSLNLLE